MSEQGKRSIKNWDAVKKADLVGCYHCLKMLSANEITEYTLDRTAICICGIDSVVVYDEYKDGSIQDFFLKLHRWHEDSF